MDDNFINAPRSRSSTPVRIIGILAIVVLVIAIIGFATGVFNFEDRSLY